MVGKGYHIALTRELAKRLFSQKDDETLIEFLEELKSSSELKKGGRILDSGTQWDAIHRCLTDGELDPTGGDFPLNTAVLGGKQLHKGDDLAAVLIRPDMINFVAEALSDIKQKEFRERFFALQGGSYTGSITEKDFTALWICLQNLKVFFEAAAENMEAVVFTAKYQAS